ncbi:hypothetical protein OPV22_022130 [Ensete ventricosum]|uniref:Bromodomain associated domain-containing protein n=1 Tax=Ensete ventricosum TaxID=4639 RepID=A0AAV8QP58_ENSVE|nr:hypothetical protein OPV22_022130 [Ensete ventricosum]
MSDGGKERGKNQQTSSKKSRPSGDADFGLAISKIAVAQICESTGFRGSHLSANDAMAEIADLSLSCGFRGASDVRQCLVSSDVVREIAKFVSTEAEVPFFRSIPRLTVPSSSQRLHRLVITYLIGFRGYLHTAADANADMVEQTRLQMEERPLLSQQMVLAMIREG